MSTASVLWLEHAVEHDFPAAADYLAMLADPPTVSALIDRLRAATVDHKKAKDILRASRLPLLPAGNAHVVVDLTKIHDGQPLSPILLIRGDFAAGVPLQIADGYHRVCASYYTDENTDIPVLLAATT